MKKLIFSICLMLLCVAFFNSRVCASFIYDIDRFTQVGGVLGTSTFVDDFDDVGELEPPDGPSGASTYQVAGTFGPTRQGGGLLELNSEDAVVEPNDVWINAKLIDSTYFFSDGVGGSITGRFEANDGFFSNTWFSVVLWNYNSTTGATSDVNEVAAEIGVDSLGNKYAVWGDESGIDNSQDITAALGAVTDITLTILMNTSNQISAMWDYGSDGSIDLAINNFHTISFLPGYVYSGSFDAGDGELDDFPNVPEPTTIALLGIGLAGLAGGAVRRRRKK